MVSQVVKSLLLFFINGYLCIGGEFDCRIMRDMLSRYGIRQFLSHSNFKCSQVEKAQLYFQNLLYRHLVSKQTYKYYPVMYDILSTYNNSYSRVIKMTPLQALEPSRGEEVSRNLSTRLSYMKVKKKKPVFNEGDVVRVSYSKNKFARGYGMNFSHRRYLVHQVNVKRPIPTYLLKSEKGTVVTGPFYDYELQRVDIPTFLGRPTGETRRIKGVKHYRFHYLGYNSSDDEWQPEVNLKKINK